MYGKEESFSYPHVEFPVFQFVLVASCPVTGYHCEDSGPSSFLPPVRHLNTLIMSPPSHFFEAKQSQLLAQIIQKVIIAGRMS